ncbi:MAG: hypothetical protein R3250_15465 [Melioribacteraceae bacterium]|nr:hypothetical protein [Melioribacteraceae bacterium]
MQRLFYKSLVGLFICLLSIQSFHAKAQFSFTAKRLQEARIFLLTDFGYKYRLNTIEYDCGFGFCKYRSHRHDAISEVGVMYNLNEKYSVGANLTTTFGFDSDDAWNGFIKLRLRRWISKDFSVDVAPGIRLFGDHQYTASADLRYKNWLIFTVRAETVDFGETHVPIYVGIKAGDLPGAISHGVSVVGAGIWILAFILAGSD